jgi:hypothetical protein
MAKATYTLTLIPFDNFGGRSKVRFGVGEQLKLDGQEKPEAKPPTPMEWSVKSGSAFVHNTSNKPGAATVQCGNEGGSVVLELRNTKDKSLLASKRFEVVAPDDVEFVKSGPDWHVKGFASAGFKGTIHLLPKDVSFKWVEVREGAAALDASGCFAGAKEAEIKGDGHFQPQDTNKSVIHPVMGTWVKAKAGGSTSKGTEMNGADTVRGATTKPGAGKFTWRIPWFYKVTGIGGERRFCTGEHQTVVDAAGKTTMSKFNITVSKAKADATSGT